jgi:hypothetical protein
LILAGILIAGVPRAVNPIVPCEGTNKIDAFVIQTDARLKGMTVRTFAETYSQQGSTWREVKPRNGSRGATATVYIARGLPAAAFFTIQTLSGDWVLYADYYFRPDGSLAKTHERLNSFHSGTSAIRDAYFGCYGEAQGDATRHLDLKTRKPKQPDTELADVRAPLFMRVQSLPFFSALHRAGVTAP